MLSLDLIEIIKDYIACSQYLCKEVKDHFSISGMTLLRARRLDLVPKEGYLSNNTYFCFHGIGCYFEFETGAIDTDFGPDDKFSGFDFGRIVNFIQLSRLEKYQNINDFAILEAQYKEFIKKGLIVCPNLHPGTHLCYLAED